MPFPLRVGCRPELPGNRVLLSPGGAGGHRVLRRVSSQLCHMYGPSRSCPPADVPGPSRAQGEDHGYTGCGSYGPGFVWQHSPSHDGGAQLAFHAVLFHGPRKRARPLRRQCPWPYHAQAHGSQERRRLHPTPPCGKARHEGDGCNNDRDVERGCVVLRASHLRRIPSG
eukprot:Rmarinus@m.9878